MAVLAPAVTRGRAQALKMKRKKGSRSVCPPERLHVNAKRRRRKLGEGLADDAEVGVGGAAQFLGLLRVAAGASFGAFHQVVGHTIGGRGTGSQG